MALVILKKDNKFWMGVSPNEYVVGTFADRSHVMEVCQGSATIIDVRRLKPVTVSRIFRKFSNGRGSTEDEAGLAEALLASKAVEMNLTELLEIFPN